jgi:pimeloyl-ACP methyl ester carboxylesterase
VVGAKPLAAFDERYSEVRAARMRYFVGGSGPPLVLVHGLTGAAVNFAELAGLLARRHRVLVPDLPGHGCSAPLPAAPSLAAYADRVRLLAEQEGMLPAVLVGHSLGGLVALRFAARHPADVKAVVLAGSAGISSATRWAERWLTLFGVLRLGRKVAPIRRQVARSPLLRELVFGHVSASDPQALSQLAVEGFLASGRLHTDTRTCARLLVRDDPRAELHRVNCPVLVLSGARDRQIGVGDAFELARRLHAPLRVIADCGHLLVGERPDACAAAIEDFLRSSDWDGQVDKRPLELERVG